jgi:crossover junction endodeoxyribonuclease RuvC
MTVRLLGIDPGLANFGYAVVECVSRNDRKLLNLGLITTAKSDKKKAVRSSDDNTRRAREIFDPISQIVTLHGIKVICAEAMSFPRSSSAAHKLGISWGLVVALSCHHSLPIVQASPQDIKNRLCANKKASKEDVQLALHQLYGADADPDQFTKTKREHPFDALGAVEACLDSEVVRLACLMADQKE